jgi:hypothetical protein
MESDDERTCGSGRWYQKMGHLETGIIIKRTTVTANGKDERDEAKAGQIEPWTDGTLGNTVSIWRWNGLNCTKH